jgi:hypothetical protein
VNFDLKTAVVTVIIFPIVYLILRITAKFLKTHTRWALEGIYWHWGHRIDQRVAARVSLRQHARGQLQSSWSRYLKVPGPTDILSLEVDDIFVPLELESTLLSRQRWSTFNVRDAGRRILVVGDPGSGKSTLIKRVHRDACRKAIYRSKTAPLCVAVELKNCKVPNVVEDDAWLYDQLKEIVAKSHGYDMEHLFDTYASTNGVLVLLDGLDEVASSNYGSVSRAINKLSDMLWEKCVSSQIILTMRLGFYNQIKNDFQDQYPVTLKVQPFSPTELYDFLTKWPFEEPTASQVNRVHRTLVDNPALRDLCTNPLILAMFVSRNQGHEDVDTPDTRTRFYQSVMDELLGLRRGRQLHVASRSALLHQRWLIVGKLAAANLIDAEQDANSIDWQTALTVISEVLRVDHEAALGALHELIRDTGILNVERDGENLHFMHLTFCEFAAAHYANWGEAYGFDVLVGSYQHFAASSQPQLRNRLDEVLPFLCAMTPPKERKVVFRKIDSSVDDSTLVARIILESQAYDDEIYQRWLGSEAADIVSTPSEDWDANWLRRLQLLTRVLRDAQLHFESMGRTTHLTSASLLEDLVKGSEERLLLLFSEFVKQDATTTLTLAEDLGVNLVQTAPNLVVEACETRAFLSMALERAQAANDSATAWASVLAEAAQRYRIVALSLDEAAPKGPIVELFSSMPSNRAWRVPAGRSGAINFYAACLSVGSDGERLDTETFPLLNTLKGGLRRPLRGSWVSTFCASLGICCLLALVGVAAAFGGVVLNDVRSSHPVLLIFALGGGLILELLGFFLLGYSGRRKRLIGNLLNLTSHYDTYSSTPLLRLLRRFPENLAVGLRKLAGLTGQLETLRYSRGADAVLKRSQIVRW